MLKFRQTYYLVSFLLNIVCVICFYENIKYADKKPS